MRGRLRIGLIRTVFLFSGSAALEYVKGELGQTTNDDPVDVAEVLTDLREKYESLKEFLGDSLDRQGDDLVVRKWMSEIKDLTYEAEELTEKHKDRIARYMQIQHRQWNGIKHWVWTVKDAMVLAREASEIYALKNKISGITSQMEAYGIVEHRQDTEPANDPIGAAMVMPYVDDDIKVIVGLDEDIKKIENQLVSTESSSTKVVGICGVDGLGKTTLAREVLKRGTVKEHFDHAIVWAFLGTEFRVVDVLRDILLKLLSGNGNGNAAADEARKERSIIAEDPDLGEDVLSVKISRILEEKRCLVVLDDLRTTQGWDRLRSAFSSVQGSSHSCSKLVITTCYIQVMSYVDHQGFVHLPRFLNCDEKWQLLQKTGALNIKRPTSIERFIINNSIGLPLTTHLIGGLLKCHATYYRWLPRTARRRGNQSLLEWELEQGLRMSHKYLGRRLALCLKVMREYPEGFEIPAEELFSKWIDDRAIICWRGSFAERVAQRCLDELVKRSLVHVVDKDSTTGKIKSCRLHSVVRNYNFNLKRSVNL